VVTLVALSAGMVVVAGTLLLASGVRKVPVSPARRATRRSFEPPPPGRVLLVVAVFVAVLAFTRWPVAAAGAGLGVGLLASTVARNRLRIDLAAQAEALATWAEMLRDATGTPRGIEGVLVATAPTAPETIRPHVEALAQRLPYEPLERALDGLADDLDHPLGDMVVTALRLSASTGGRQIRSVLNDLVTVAREEARMHGRVDVARARPRAQMRILLVMMAVFVGGLTLLAQGYLEPYRTLLGQVVLLFIGLCWAASLWLMGRLGQHHHVERFLFGESMT
jgi:Flp pilus assembly protein TadB